MKLFYTLRRFSCLRIIIKNYQWNRFWYEKIWDEIFFGLRLFSSSSLSSFIAKFYLKSAKLWIFLLLSLRFVPLFFTKEKALLNIFVCFIFNLILNLYFIFIAIFYYNLFLYRRRANGGEGKGNGIGLRSSTSFQAVHTQYHPMILPGKYFRKSISFPSANIEQLDAEIIPMEYRDSDSSLTGGTTLLRVAILPNAERKEV